MKEKTFEMYRKKHNEIKYNKTEYKKKDEIEKKHQHTLLIATTMGQRAACAA